MQKWDYHLLSFSPDEYDSGRSDRAVKALAMWGADGWEVVSVTPIIGELSNPGFRAPGVALAGTVQITVLLRRPQSETPYPIRLDG